MKFPDFKFSRSEVNYNIVITAGSCVDVDLDRNLYLSTVNKVMLLDHLFGVISERCEHSCKWNQCSVKCKD